MDFFIMAPEAFWDPGSKKTREEKRIIFDTAVESNEYLASEKIDGHWYRFVCQDGEAKFQSRGISAVTGEYGERQEHVPHIFNYLKEHFTDTTVLLGEIYFPGKKDRDVTTIMGCGVEKALARQEKEKLHYYIFDTLALNGDVLVTMPFEYRVDELEKYRDLLEQNPYIKVANYVEGHDIYDLLNDVLGRDGEGVVLTKKISLPKPGGRIAKKTIKVKSEIDNDVDVFLTGRFLPSTRLYNGKEIESWKYWENLKTGEKHNEEKFFDYSKGESLEPVTKGWFYDWPGSLEVGVFNKKGDVVSLGYVSGLTESLKDDFSKDREKYVLMPCKVSCMEFTDDFKMRHPRFKGFRNDIGAGDCTFEKIFSEGD